MARRKQLRQHQDGQQVLTLERPSLENQLDTKTLRELRAAIAQLLVNAARSDGQEVGDE